jgi:hypothetical protein
MYTLCSFYLDRSLVQRQQDKNNYNNSKKYPKSQGFLSKCSTVYAYVVLILFDVIIHENIVITKSNLN